MELGEECLLILRRQKDTVIKKSKSELLSETFKKKYVEKRKRKLRMGKMYEQGMSYQEIADAVTLENPEVPIKKNTVNTYILDLVKEGVIKKR